MQRRFWNSKTKDKGPAKGPGREETMRKTYTFEIVWEFNGRRKVINTFAGQKDKRRAENWMFDYIRRGGYFCDEFRLRRTEE